MPSKQLSLPLNINPRNFLIQSGPWYQEVLLQGSLMSASLTSPISMLQGLQQGSQSGILNHQMIKKWLSTTSNRKGQPLLGIIVGDSLLEPFWPEGTGCARGFLSAMDAGWMMRDWFLGQKNPLKILAEREMTRSILNQTTDGNLVQNFKSYSIDPRTRYGNTHLTIAFF